MVQQAITDGGIVSQPYAHFDSHRSIYLYIQERLDRTLEGYLNLPEIDRIKLLFDSATYALLTAQAPLERADMAFQSYHESGSLDADELAQLFSDDGLNYCVNKAEYIDRNSKNTGPFYRADRAIRDDRIIDAQQSLMDVHGLGPAKSAFSLAMMGVTRTACLDAHICRYFDVDPRAYEKHDARQYLELVDRTFAPISNLVDETSHFLTQWITWDVARGRGVEYHDSWFEHVARFV